MFLVILLIMLAFGVALLAVDHLLETTRKRVVAKGWITARKGLGKFLKANAQNDTARKLIPQAMDALEPLFLIAKSGYYDGSKAQAVTQKEAAEAIALAVSQKVTRVIPVNPDGRLFPKPEWMTEMVYHKAVKDSLGHSLVKSLDTSLDAGLSHSLGHSLWENLGHSLWENLWESLDTNLGSILWTSLWAGLGYSLWLWKSLDANLGSILFYYLGLVLTGDRETVGRLEPLIRLLPSCIPLGEKRGEPGTWIYLDFSSKSE